MLSKVALLSDRSAHGCVSAAIFAGTTQELGIALILLSAVLGAMLGSTIGFWIGDRYGYPLLLRYGSYIGLTETRIKIAQYLFRRQGMVVVLIARFVAVLRSVVGFIAGANRMPFVNFMIANSAGAVAWALFYGLGAYHLGKRVEELARPFLGDFNSSVRCRSRSEAAADIRTDRQPRSHVAAQYRPQQREG